MYNMYHMNFPESPALSPEVEPKLLFKVTLMRHEKPYYRNEGHDLTPTGVLNAKARGEKFKAEVLSDEDEMFLLHSPSPRAKGTIEFVRDAAGLEDKTIRSIDQIRNSDTKDHGAIMNRFEELGKDNELSARDQYYHPMHLETPDIIETHSHKRERLYRAFEYLIRWFDKHPQGYKIPHVLAVSHFEILTHIINDVFDIKKIGIYNTPAFGESIYIQAYETGEDSKILLDVTYNDRNKRVYFNRKNRSVEVIETEEGK